MSAAAPLDFAIGTVANLTGLDPHTIRAWERRYGAVHPRRTHGGTRRYGEADVTRLQLLKALTECGEPIGRAARLGDDELRAHLARLSGISTPDAGTAPGQRPLHLALLDPRLADQIRANPDALAGFEMRVARDEREAFVDALRLVPCDVLVLAFERMGPEPLRLFDACREASGARLAVIVYTFARRAQLARLGNRGAKLVRGPLRVEQLRRAIEDLVVMREARRHRRPAAHPVDDVAETSTPERIFADDQLARLTEIASAVDCECPNHLASLVSSLLAFEAYSRGCQARDDPDAALHARLEKTTGEARARMERALAELCENDGIAV